MSVKHRRFERLIPAYLEGALSDRQRRWFDGKLREDDACRSELQIYRRMREEVARTDVEYPAPYVWQGFNAALRRRIEDAGPVDDAPYRRRRILGLDVLSGAVGGAVCGALAAFGVVYFGFSSGFLPSMSSTPSEASLAQAAAMDARFTRLTADPGGVAVSLVAVGADGVPLHVSATLEPAQLLQLLRAEVTASEAQPADEWIEFTPVLDGERAPIDLYGGSSVFVVSTATGW